MPIPPDQLWNDEERRIRQNALYRQAEIEAWRLLLDDYKLWLPDEYPAQLAKFQEKFPGENPDL